MRLMRSRIFVTEDSYEYHEDSLLAAKSRTDWFFRLDVLDTAFGGEVDIEECQDRYIHVGLAASRAVARNRLIQVNS